MNSGIPIIRYIILIILQFQHPSRGKMHVYLDTLWQTSNKNVSSTEIY